MNKIRHEHTNYDDVRRALEYNIFDQLDITIVLNIEINKILCKLLGYEYGFHTDWLSDMKKIKYRRLIHESPENFRIYQ